MLKNKIIYFIIVIYAGILVVLYNRIQTLHAFIIIAGVFLVMFLFPRLVRGKVDVSLEVPKKISVAEKCIEYRVNMNNKSRLPIGYVKVFLEVRDRKERVLEMKKVGASIEGHGKATIVCSLKAKYAGILHIQIRKSKLYDYLHIFSSKVKINLDQEIVIMPQICEMQIEIPLLEGTQCEDTQKYSSYQPGNDPSEVFGIREYRPGDKLQRIHWKLSTKSKSVLVKEYSLPVSSSVAILLDQKQSKNTIRDRNQLLQMVFSLSHHLLERQVIHELFWYQANYEDMYQAEISDHVGLYEAMHESLVNEYDCKELVLDYFYEMFGSHNYENLFFITNEISQEEIILLERLFVHTKVQIINVCEKKEIGTANKGIFYNWIDAKHMQDAVASMVLS